MDSGCITIFLMVLLLLIKLSKALFVLMASKKLVLCTKIPSFQQVFGIRHFARQYQISDQIKNPSVTHLHSLMPSQARTNAQTTSGDNAQKILAGQSELMSYTIA